MVPRWLCRIVLFCWSIATAAAIEVQIDDNDQNRMQCAGMYSRAAWGGNVDPYILVSSWKASEYVSDDAVVSLIIYEYKDVDLIGISVPDEPKIYICDQDEVNNNFCNSTEIGEFIVTPNNTELAKNLIFTTAIHLKDPGQPIHYDIKNTGYYCVTTSAFTSGQTYSAILEFRNAYGELPAAQIVKLPFYGGITIAYAVIGAFWAFFYVQHRHDILPVQNYITAIIIFLVIEMLMTWGFYDYENQHGANIGSKVLVIVVAILNAGRNSFSFFLLLIVCMGYGVVKPSLGQTMIHVRWLAAAHFVFGLIYAVASLTIAPDDAGPLVLFVILPLAGTLTAFYIWTLNSLKHTMADLEARKQTVKLGMYRKLWYCILLSIFTIFGFFFFNSFTFAGVSDPDFAPNNWQTRWFILDGWLNLVYFADVAFICYMWLPTANNRRFAMSDEIAQDDEGFEIADFGAEESVDGDAEARDAEEARRAQEGPRYDPPSAAAARRTVPADALQESAPRESLDGETIFAVGEDGDKWSDDEEDAQEGKKQAGKDS